MKSAESLIADRVLPLLCDPATAEDLRPVPVGFASSTTTYPIVRGVPRFISTDKYVGSFSFEWNVHARTQLDKFRGDHSSEQQFVAKTGFSPSQLAGKLVLDAGIGAGRFAEVASRWGANVVGVDLSFAVEAAYQNLGDRPNVWIAQADIGCLPFRRGSFDFIFSIGVLHHTPNTKDYFRKLLPLLKPGGVIAIWVYPPEDAYVIRQRWVPFINKLPPKTFYAWCRWFVPWVQSRTDTVIGGLVRSVFPYSSQGLGLENDILDTFDGYSPRYHWLHSPEEVISWFNEAGLEDVHQPSAWKTSVRGRWPE
jgi:SAM-dependent methyltransferase